MHHGLKEDQYTTAPDDSKLVVHRVVHTVSCRKDVLTPPTILGVGFRVPNACSGWQVTPYVLRYQFSMSTEKLPLQPLVNHAAGGQETEPDPGSLPETGQEDSKEHGDQALHKTKLKRFKGIFITVIVLVGFAVINAAVSVILPFYPIVVSSLIHHPS